MIYTNNGEYKPNIFFTSDTHFSQKRTLELSKRPFKSVEEMDNTIIENWNSIIGKNDIVYHLGDFGNTEICQKLNGKIKLILGNYEFNNSGDFPKYVTEYGKSGQELTKVETELMDSDKDYLSDRFYEYKEFMIEAFGFDDVLIRDINNPFSPFVLPLELSDFGIKHILLSHKPSEIKRAVYDINNHIMSELFGNIHRLQIDNSTIFGLFGHIHRLQMVRRYGLNVGIDCNHFYPFSIDDVKFQINGIRNHYDSEVFDDD